jgi:hypothetical protein
MRGHRSGGRRLVLAATAAALLASPLVLHAQSRAALKGARRLLEKLKLVDGAGSGLDADTVRGVAPLLVHDANGAVVGTLIVANDTPFVVARTIDGRPMRLQITDEGVVDTTCPQFCYATADCTGTPYREASDAFFPSVSVCGGTAYYPTGPAQPQPLVACQITGGPCTPQPLGDQRWTEVATFDVAGLGLVPPFHLDPP